MGKIPTAEEFLKKLDEESGTTWTEDDDEICKAFIEFAKLHVKAALEAANSSTKTQEWIDNFINLKDRKCKKAILDCYPENLIV